jgi:hypothetical protein
MNDKQTIVGEGKQSVILISGAETIGLKIPEDASFCEIKHLLIRGTSTSNYTGSYGIYVEPYTNTSNTYDSSHIIEDVKVRYIDGTGVFIGEYNRGCAITNVGVKNCNGHGIYVEGTDNELSNIGAARCSKHGIYLSQNNRLYSAKAYLCGSDTSDDYYSLYLAQNYNNIACYDLQQSLYNGIYIGGSGNNISFASDGVGYNNTDTDAHISVIVLGDNTNSNRIVGTVTQGTLNGMFNHLVSTKGIVYNNYIDITYRSVIYYPKDVTEIYGSPLPSDNHYFVNSEEKISNWNYVSINKNNFDVRYKSTTQNNAVKTTTNGSVTITDRATPIGVNGGFWLLFGDMNSIVSNGNYDYLYVEIELDTNFPIHPNFYLDVSCYGKFANQSNGVVGSTIDIYDITVSATYTKIVGAFKKPSSDYGTFQDIRFHILNKGSEAVEQSEDFDFSSVEITVKDVKFAYI